MVAIHTLLLTLVVPGLIDAFSLTRPGPCKKVPFSEIPECKKMGCGDGGSTLVCPPGHLHRLRLKFGRYVAGGDSGDNCSDEKAFDKKEIVIKENTCYVLYHHDNGNNHEAIEWDDFKKSTEYKHGSKMGGPLAQNPFESFSLEWKKNSRQDLLQSHGRCDLEFHDDYMCGSRHPFTKSPLKTEDHFRGSAVGIFQNVTEQGQDSNNLGAGESGNVEMTNQNGGKCFPGVSRNVSLAKSMYLLCDDWDTKVFGGEKGEGQYDPPAGAVKEQNAVKRFLKEWF